MGMVGSDDGWGVFDAFGSTDMVEDVRLVIQGGGALEKLVFAWFRW